ncbi:MAG: cytochrome c-type biogenesis protein [Microbacteriaceae bacterium]
MSRRWQQWWLAGIIVALLGVVTAGLLVAGPAPQDRAYAIQQRLRCPVCKTVSIAQSPSDTAAQMRRIVEEQVVAGRSDEEIVGYFTKRYGEWILLDPPLEGRTVLLWLLPFVAAGGGILVFATRARRPREGGLAEADRSRVQAALRDYRARSSEDEEP